MKNTLLISKGFDESNIPWHGNKYLIGNGYMGVRGTLEEFKKEHMPAINLGGIYEKVGDKWRESLNAPNGFYTYIVVNGEKFTLPEKECDDFTQSLDFFEAIHKRETVWNVNGGKVKITCERFASMKNFNYLGMEYKVEADFDCKIEIYTGIDGDIWDINGPHLHNLTKEFNNNYACVYGFSNEKNIEVKTTDFIICDNSFEEIKDEFTAMRKIVINNNNFSFKKIIKVETSVDEEKTEGFITDFDKLKEEHINAWKEIWFKSYVEIDGDDEAEFSLNYSLYHLNCIAPRFSKNKSIAARGLSGQVYKGAVFWDTEMFMLDYYLHSDPKVAKTLVNYRIDTLQGALNKAKSYGLDGAFYAWESHEGGFDACSDYNVVDVFTKRPMRTFFKDKQYHISGAVIYGFKKYIEATNDYSILEGKGIITVIECAKFYRSLLLKKVDSSEYEIHEAVGPDEYHEKVKNNAYTNRMAKFTFDFAVSMIDYIKNNNSKLYESLSSKYDINALIKILDDSSKNIKIIKPDENGIIEQFDGYFDLEDCSVDDVRSRLLDPKEYWGGAYGVASQTKIIKQADVIAMLSIFKEDYSLDILDKNWNYYEPKTEHGSSLSACMYSLVGCYTGKTDIAYPFFMKSAKADLTKGGKEWAGLIYIGGTHPASEGGAWIVAINGFAGVETINGEIKVNPHLPDNWNSMKFKYLYLGKLYEIKVFKNSYEINEIGD